MIVVRITKSTRMIGGAFVRLLFQVAGAERQVVVPSLHAPGVGELAVFVSNREFRPQWMKSPTLAFHGRGEAMGLRNDGGLYACVDFDGQGETDVRFALSKPRMTTDPMFQDWAIEGLDVTSYYLSQVVST
jgi:hypothetical protein